MCEFVNKKFRTVGKNKFNAFFKKHKKNRPNHDIHYTGNGETTLYYDWNLASGKYEVGTWDYRNECEIAKTHYDYLTGKTTYEIPVGKYYAPFVYICDRKRK